MGGRGGEVPADPDSSTANELGFALSERRCVKLGVVHVADMLVGLAVAVVLVYNFIEKRSEGVVRVVRAGVDTHT